MTEIIEIQPSGPILGRIRPPGSKSITNRALTCAALAGGRSTLSAALDSEDTRVMVDGLNALGIPVDALDNRQTLFVEGCHGEIPAHEADLFVGNSGTTIRFLTALVGLGQGRYRLDGVERMRQRPIGDLLAALRAWGVHARSETDSGCPPVIVESTGISGGSITVRGDISSQYLSGLLMAAPAAKSEVEIRVDGSLVSTPYVRMTLEVMRAFGVDVDATDMNRFRIAAPVPYSPREYEIEPDASAASYSWAAAAITRGSVTVEGLSRDSLQGDVRFCECLQQMGCGVSWQNDGITVSGGDLRGIDVDMNDISDTAQTMAAVALFADGPTRIRGIEHNRHKETDRIGDLACELERLGAGVEQHPDGLTITPAPLRPATIETYGDHRMAMSLSLVGLRHEGVRIKNPRCTEKTYPDFFHDLDRLCRGSV